MGLVRVEAGTSYSPSRASITPCNRPSCCRKSCSTLQKTKTGEQYLAVEKVSNPIYVCGSVGDKVAKIDRQSDGEVKEKV